MVAFEHLLNMGCTFGKTTFGRIIYLRHYFQKNPEIDVINDINRMNTILQEYQDRNPGINLSKAEKGRQKLLTEKQRKVVEAEAYAMLWKFFKSDLVSRRRTRRQRTRRQCTRKQRINH